MHIDALTLTDFRNFEEAKLLPGRQINLIVGHNGSGKTSLLESIYCLGSGRSFRPGTHKQIIRHEQSSFTIFARGTDEQGDKHALGFQRDREGLVKIRVDGELVRRFGQMAQLVPVQLMTPETVELVLGGPRVRRQFLDWGVFHVEHRYIGEITSFNHVLKQRNSLLKQRRVGQEGDYWDTKFAELGEQVAAERQKYWSGFEPVLLDRLKHFLPEYDFKIILKQGWDGDLSLRDAMAKNKSAEDRYGHAIVGPHKAELKMLANGEDVKSILSRGQLKLFVAAIKVVQGEYLFAKTGVQCIYLVDDITAELDAGSQQKFCEALVATKAQLFVSAINKGELPEIIRSADTRMFHVEHGTVKEL
ncbi:DNA replication/repair protein RecF [Pseudidiomarina terrestris]|uniref:DNA replication and repair protein RecF n=1 Tax=Pseudidiomarina terrestris TaxID=2820060 RepID=A0AAW7R4E3_9GAMM|nr:MULTISPECIES: DNA replication/repair protein RecF [unclassified Pseudidiomarina]MDN7125389.1 DNA replication/repair protein RecF [Pseudidiomarina sp. 1APP75-32.1]MDN7130147.1 DNA replication/repair protein RecF [Pseudidiomarina sp. 1APR75-15]MDN7135652.1 DNA replication/repair protein RecF [Pseudidiomarina sp. 1ASP75-5]MDN7137310.1 DNA replication/repair protein RecF [Pseudidiomarina sp. 1ASP75-14]MEA3588603.1 DNA replication/repair protein RecF [Pseudidiomarina sp. 1APP75-27a]